MKTDPNESITPVIYRQIGENEFRIASEKDLREGIYLSSKNGLTKREHFAAKAMQGILSSGVYEHNGQYIGSPKEMYSRCVDAVQWADALISALNETEQ